MKFRTCNVKVNNWLGYVSASLPTDYNIISLSEIIKKTKLFSIHGVVKTAKKKSALLEGFVGQTSRNPEWVTL